MKDSTFALPALAAPASLAARSSARPRRIPSTHAHRPTPICVPPWHLYVVRHTQLTRTHTKHARHTIARPGPVHPLPTPLVCASAAFVRGAPHTINANPHRTRWGAAGCGGVRWDAAGCGGMRRGMRRDTARERTRASKRGSDPTHYSGGWRIAPHPHHPRRTNARRNLRPSTESRRP